MRLQVHWIEKAAQVGDFLTLTNSATRGFSTAEDRSLSVMDYPSADVARMELSKGAARVPILHVNASVQQSYTELTARGFPPLRLGCTQAREPQCRRQGSKPDCSNHQVPSN